MGHVKLNHTQISSLSFTVSRIGLLNIMDMLFYKKLRIFLYFNFHKEFFKGSLKAVGDTWEREGEVTPNVR